MENQNDIPTHGKLATDAIAAAIESKLSDCQKRGKIVGLAVTVKAYPNPNDKVPQTEIQIKLNKVPGASIDTSLPQEIGIVYAPSNTKDRQAPRPSYLEEALSPDVVEAAALGLEQFLQTAEYDSADVIVTDYGVSREAPEIEVLGENEAAAEAFGLPFKIVLISSPIGWE
jgi:regulator of RNase E activity RraA